ncbi:MAG: alpha/beta hydrolase family protein [Planctomycetota bacterium]|jgi:acetyl esterase/lipase
MTGRRSFAVSVLLLAGALLAVGASTGCNTWRAGRVLRDTLAGSRAVDGSLTETRLSVETRAGVLPVRIYRPRGDAGPLPAFLLVHGASIDGAADPRFVALARALSARGATVATPEIRSLAELRLDPDEPGRLADVAVWLGERVDLTADGRVAVMGISVGGSYSLLAALDARLQPRLASVLVFGAYADLEALLLEWLTSPGATPGLLDPFTEGRRRVLAGNLDTLVEPVDRQVVAGAIRALLQGRAVPEPAGLGPRATRVMAAARSDRPMQPSAAEDLIVPLAQALSALSPADVEEVPAAPIFLLHASSDPVVALEHGLALHELLRRRGADVRLHTTELFTHVDAGHTPSLFEAWPLLRFFAAYLETAGM